MSACARCGAKGVVLYGHHGHCDDCYRKHRQHQAELEAENQRNRELLAARIVHPAGRSFRRQRDWVQKLDPETGRATS